MRLPRGDRAGAGDTAHRDGRRRSRRRPVKRQAPALDRAAAHDRAGEVGARRHGRRAGDARDGPRCKRTCAGTLRVLRLAAGDAQLPVRVVAPAHDGPVASKRARVAISRGNRASVREVLHGVGPGAACHRADRVRRRLAQLGGPVQSPAEHAAVCGQRALVIVSGAQRDDRQLARLGTREKGSVGLGRHRVSAPGIRVDGEAAGSARRHEPPVGVRCVRGADSRIVRRVRRGTRRGGPIDAPA